MLARDSQPAPWRDSPRTLAPDPGLHGGAAFLQLWMEKVRKVAQEWAGLGWSPSLVAHELWGLRKLRTFSVPQFPQLRKWG